MSFSSAVIRLTWTRWTNNELLITKCAVLYVWTIKVCFRFERPTVWTFLLPLSPGSVAKFSAPALPSPHYIYIYYIFYTIVGFRTCFKRTYRILQNLRSLWVSCSGAQGPSGGPGPGSPCLNRLQEQQVSAPSADPPTDWQTTWFHQQSAAAHVCCTNPVYLTGTVKSAVISSSLCTHVLSKHSENCCCLQNAQKKLLLFT